ncbi:MAG: hypothetical protein KAR20_29575, partial [Candidatus Heimdallarchaeota archaeon]|nr:hypothetical protein [Candidatus Heimdallarchaeota archaeon]
VWFMADTFYDAQNCGCIPLDEPFAPLNIYSISSNNKEYPLRITHDIEKDIRRIISKSKRRISQPSWMIWKDHDVNIYYALAYLQIDKNIRVYAKTGMRNQNFPGFSLLVNDILSQIALFDLYHKVQESINNNINIIPAKQNKMEMTIKKFKKDKHLCEKQSFTTKNDLWMKAPSKVPPSPIVKDKQRLEGSQYLMNF